ncbi:MAG TPA: PEPxxWA-CTERM sorting domain-containing protein [Caulobacteraceae bacterium]|jgi:hypothetical protein|nr:PEPxxWA-CTERM sorting domain-containing protein [Caulobacteraceae bacterium]
MRYTALVGLAGALCLGFAPVAATAASVLGINGDAQVDSSTINFGQFPAGPPYAPPPGYGSFEVSLVNPGVFASNGVTVGESGMIESIPAVAGPVTLPTAFMTFDIGGSNLQLWATNVAAGNHGPFTLIDTPFGAVASLNTSGYVLDTTTSKRLGDYTMIASATFAGETVAELLASPTPIETPFSATFTFTAVPEPATWAMMLIGVGAMGIALRSKRRTNSFA